MNPGSDLDSLPVLDTPYEIVVRAFASLIGELHIAINTMPQLSYSMSSITRYVSKVTPAHLTYAKVVLRYLIGIKKRQLTWRGQRVSFFMSSAKSCEILAFVDSSWADDKNNRRSSKAYYLFVNNATFSWRSTLSQIVALSTTEAELMALASCKCDIVWRLSLELGFPQLNLPIFTKTTLVASLLLTTCTFLVAISTLLCQYALFRNLFRTD